MAKLTDKACKKHDLLLSEGMALLAISTTTDETYRSLVSKGLITKANGTMQSLNRKYSATEKGIALAGELLADSEESIVIKEDSIKELADKLKSFFRRYGEYTPEQILEATQRYVASFNGNYTYLRLLKYFIWKDENKDGETLQVSQLADWIENKGSVNPLNSDWTTILN